MKKQKWVLILCMALALMLFCVGTGAFAQASGEPIRLALVNNPTPPGHTPLYEEADADANILFYYHNGTPVTIYDDYDNGYSRVMIGDIGGYMQTNLLLDDFPDGIPYELPVVEISNIGEDQVVNFRMLPMKGSTSLNQVKFGQELLVLGEGEHWYHVMLDDKMGFVGSEFLLETERTEVYALNADGSRVE